MAVGAVFSPKVSDSALARRLFASIVLEPLISAGSTLTKGSTVSTVFSDDGVLGSEGVPRLTAFGFPRLPVQAVEDGIDVVFSGGSPAKIANAVVSFDVVEMSQLHPVGSGWQEMSSNQITNFFHLRPGDVVNRDAGITTFVDVGLQCSAVLPSVIRDGLSVISDGVARGINNRALLHNAQITLQEVA